MILWLSGQSGAGKTTLGKNLSKMYHSFVHFDGDVYFSGGDPIHDAGTYKGNSDASSDLKVKWEIVVKNYNALFDGIPVPVEDWVPALDPLVHAAADVAKAQPPMDVAISFSVYQRPVREWIEGRFYELTKQKLQFVVLNDADGSAPKRKLEQFKAAAAAQGKSMEEFTAQYGTTHHGEEELLRRIARMQSGFEPGVEADGEIAVRIGADDGAEAVLHTVAARLNLGAPSTVK